MDTLERPPLLPDIVIGGVAAAIHGSARATIDLDVVYNRTDDNIARLVWTR